MPTTLRYMLSSSSIRQCAGNAMDTTQGVEICIRVVERDDGERKRRNDADTKGIVIRHILICRKPRSADLAPETCAEPEPATPRVLDAETDILGIIIRMIQLDGGRDSLILGLVRFKCDSKLEHGRWRERLKRRDRRSVEQCHLARGADIGTEI